MEARAVSLGAQVMCLWLVVGLVTVGGGVAQIITAGGIEDRNQADIATVRAQVADTRKVSRTADAALRRAVAANTRARRNSVRAVVLVKCLTRPTRRAVNRCLGAQPGAPGQPGTVGVPGTPGRAGRSIQGLVGPKGDPGVTGPAGPPGATVTGPGGVDGKDGAAGVDGTPGAVGAQGNPGVDGAVGPVGPQGTPGVDGAVGPEGPPGADGAPAVFPASLTCTPDPPPAVTLTCVPS
jgi:hypothetical protein